jgi:hypothetical protein
MCIEGLLNAQLAGRRAAKAPICASGFGAANQRKVHSSSKPVAPAVLLPAQRPRLALFHKSSLSAPPPPVTVVPNLVQALSPQFPAAPSVM